MNRRGFLNQFLKGAIVSVAAPQIVTHGLKLWVPKRDVGQLKYAANFTFRDQLPKRNSFWFQSSYTPNLSEDQWQAALDACLKLKQKREAEGRNSVIDFYTDKRGKEYLERWL